MHEYSRQTECRYILELILLLLKIDLKSVKLSSL